MNADEEQSRSACAQQNGLRASAFASTSSEQESMLGALLVKFLFQVQHFGNKLNGG
jgi:hypothetical protein